MWSARAAVAWCSLLGFVLAGVFIVPARAQSIPVAEQPAAGADRPPPGQLMVHMALPPGTLNASLFLNDSFVAWLQGGVLPAPLALLPGGYAVRISAPGLRSYETTLQLLPGQLLDLQGSLVAEQPLVPPPVLGPAPPLVPVAPPLAPIRKPRSAAGTYQAVIWGIGLTALGLAVIAGITTGIVCAAGKCKSSSRDD
jgi:hypothetical protein